jgi:hypothetical protein
MGSAQLALALLEGGRGVGIRGEVVAQQQAVVPQPAVELHQVQVEVDRAALGVMEPAGQAALAAGAVADGLQRLDERRRRRIAVDADHDVDHRRCRGTRQRGAADMDDARRGQHQRVGHAYRLGVEMRAPGRGIGQAFFGGLFGHRPCSSGGGLVGSAGRAQSSGVLCAR